MRRTIAENCGTAIRDLSGTVVPDTPEESVMLKELERLRLALPSIDACDGADEVVRALRVLADQMAEAGALWLAFSALGHLRLAAASAAPRELGLAMADQAWVARSIGDLDTAEQLYSGVSDLGEAFAQPELSARALLGKGVCARIRGNYPRARSLFQDGLARATAAGLTELESVGHQGLLIAAGTAGDCETALVHGWAAYELASGNADREAELLINVSQVSLVAGYPEAALRGFLASLVRTATLRFRLPSLAGAAVASARIRNSELVSTIARVAEDSVIAAALPFETASALRALSEAFGCIGDAARAEDYRLRARSLARKNGFFEIVLATEPKDVVAPAASEPSRRQLNRESLSVIHSLEAMESEADAALVAAIS